MSNTAPYFSGIGTASGPGVSGMGNLLQSLQSDNAAPSRTNGASIASASPTPTPNIVVVSSKSSPSPSSLPSSANQPSTLSTVISSAASVPNSSRSTTAPPSTLSNSLSSMTSGSSTSAVPTNAVSSDATTSTVAAASSCSGISCSPGLQAAVAVPVVVVVLGLIGLFAFCFMRRRRRRRSQTVAEPTEKGFSGGFKKTGYTFEHEKRGLVVKQLSQSTNKSSVGTVVRADSPNLRETKQRFSIVSDRPSLKSDPRQMTGNPVSPVRPLSPLVTNAPPQIATSGVLDHRKDPDGSGRPEIRDPFTDSAQQSPIEQSPFDDPPDPFRPVPPIPSDQLQGLHSSHIPIIRRSVSHDSNFPDSRSIHTESDGDANTDAGSIREAQIGRRVSVASRRTIDSDHGDVHQARMGRHLSVVSAGRTIENVRRDS